MPSRPVAAVASVASVAARLRRTARYEAPSNPRYSIVPTPLYVSTRIISALLRSLRHSVL